MKARRWAGAAALLFSASWRVTGEEERV